MKQEHHGTKTRKRMLEIELMNSTIPQMEEYIRLAYRYRWSPETIGRMKSQLQKLQARRDGRVDEHPIHNN